MSNLRSIYTDGGCNIYRGAWAWVEVRNGEVIAEDSGFNTETTNNRMEMEAIINAIKRLPLGTKIRIYSDSGYVVTGINHPSYLKKWMHNGWITSTKKPVENRDLWEIIIDLIRYYDIDFVLIKGHSKDKSSVHTKWNNLVDDMCSKIMREMGFKK